MEKTNNAFAIWSHQRNCDNWIDGSWRIHWNIVKRNDGQEKCRKTKDHWQYCEQL